MSRPAREFSSAEVKAMVERFNAGQSTKQIGQQQRPPCSEQVIGRVLKPILGDLRAAKAVVKVRRSLERGWPRHQDYREGFAAGYRMALTHTNLHGMERTREHWSKCLLPWREMGLDDIPPEFIRSS